MKKISLTFLFSCFAILLFSQPKLEFKNTYYDFGEIKEENGKVTGRFEFTNVGDSNLILVNVRPGCGCTAADYTKTPIKPNEKGFIDATYDPYNRQAGGFTKNIRVYTNEPQFKNPKNPPHLIYIKGFAIKRPPTIYEIAGYVMGHGMLRMKTNSCKFILKNTEFYTDTIKFKNFDTKSIEILDIKYPVFVRELSKSFVKEIQPNEEAIIVVQFDASQRNAWGKHSDPITFKTTDSLEPNKIFIFNSEIREDFSYIKPGSNLPAIQLSATEINFEQLKKGEPFDYEVTIRNNGKGDLIIRNISSSLNAIQYQLENNVIRPNKKVTLTISFNSNYRVGKHNGSVEIITNDPNMSKAVIRVFGEVLP